MGTDPLNIGHSLQQRESSLVNSKLNPLHIHFRHQGPQTDSFGINFYGSSTQVLICKWNICYQQVIGSFPYRLIVSCITRLSHTDSFLIIDLITGFYVCVDVEVRLDSGCIKPETPEHGEMFVLWSGLLVQFRCQSSEYKLVGPAAVICRNRTWTQDPPVCLHHHQLQVPPPADGEWQEFQQIYKCAAQSSSYCLGTGGREEMRDER